jgi:cytosine deaminase
MDMDIFMKCAVEEAETGLREGGIPIGSVLVCDGRIIGRGRNRRVQDDDPVLHAEIDCLRDAGRVRSYAGCTLYSTLMPCYLCAGAAVQFGIGKVVAGESKNFAGAREFLESHGVEVLDLDLDVCKEMMGTFIAEHPDLWYEDIGEL